MTHTRGYTLIEMMVVIGIIAIIFPALFFGIHSLYSTHAHTLAKARSLNEATKGLHEVLTNIRSATYGEDGSLPITNIGANTLTLYTDTGAGSKAEKVRYFLSGTDLNKGVIAPTNTNTYPPENEVLHTIIQHITNQQTGTPIFTYYDADGNTLDAVAESTLSVQRINIAISVDVPFGSTHASSTLTSSATVRNLKHVY